MFNADNCPYLCGSSVNYLLSAEVAVDRPVSDQV